MERIPILKMGPYLLVTIQVDMHDRVAMTLQDELTEQFSLLSYGAGLGQDISSYWDELLDLVESVRSASRLN